MGREFAKNCKKVGILIHGDFIIGLPGETKESIQRTIDFAQELDAETIQVSIAHAFPGTEMHEYLAKNGFLADRPMSDAMGHQLPHIEYPGLSREEMMAAVNRFYDSYYFRPRVAWRIVRKAIWDAQERNRLYKEAVEYLRLRSERWRYARKPSSSNSEVTLPTTKPVTRSSVRP